jgi:hypothetical protein
VLAAAFMSHTSTFPLLFGACVLSSVLFYWRGGSELRPFAITVLCSAALALFLAVTLYYGHFGETYRSEFARIGAETAAAAPDAGGRGIRTRAGTVPFYLVLNYGFPLLVLTAVGAWRLWQTGARDALTLTATGWGLCCLAFLALGVLTPVDMRYYLAAIPALAVTAASGAAFLWFRKGAARALAMGLLAWIVWTGTERLWTILG